MYIRIHLCTYIHAYVYIQIYICVYANVRVSKCYSFYFISSFVLYSNRSIDHRIENSMLYDRRILRIMFIMVETSRNINFYITSFKLKNINYIADIFMYIAYIRYAHTFYVHINYIHCLRNNVQ